MYKVMNLLVEETVLFWTYIGLRKQLFNHEVRIYYYTKLLKGNINIHNDY